MCTFLEKWIKAHKAARVWVAAIYLFITLTISLDHTCQLRKAGPLTCYFVRTYHYCCGESYMAAQPEVMLKPDNCRTDALSRNSLCATCMYSNTCKTTQVNSGGSLIGTKVKPSVQLLPPSIVVKQPEWASSIVLRGPPFITS